VASLVTVVSAVLVLFYGQTDTHRHTDTDERFTPATFIGVSKQNADKRTDRGLLEAGQKMLML